MAEHKVQGGDMLLFIDPNGADDYSIVVCLTSVGVSDSISVVDASSACGPDKSPGTLEISYSFEGQHLQDPDTGKISGTDLRILLRSETTIGWKMAPESPIDGDEIHEGTGYLSELSSTYAFDSVGTFTGTLQPYGEPSIIIFGGGGGLTVGQEYQGGKIAWLDETGVHGIILAPDDFSGIFSESFDDLSALLWDQGQGAINTAAILSIITNPSNSVAYTCSNYSNGGYTDWFLPSINDVNAIRTQNGFILCGYPTVGIYPSNDESPSFFNKAFFYDVATDDWYDSIKTDVRQCIPTRYF